MAETTILVYVLHFPADSCETLDHLPVAHLEHSVAPGPLYFPAGHDLHSAAFVAPCVDIYLPPGQTWHLCFSLKYPGLHVHVVRNVGDADSSAIVLDASPAAVLHGTQKNLETWDENDN